MQDCFDTTDWDVLCRPHREDIDGLTECITDYINFCEDSIVSTRSVECYPNNTTWVTTEIKAILNEKRAFRDGNKMEEAGVQALANMREVWSGMKTIAGYRLNCSRGVEGGQERANKLN